MTMPYRLLRTLCALPLLFATSLAAQQSSLTGEWVFTVESPNGTGTRQVTLVQEGDSLSGTIASSRAAGDITGWIEGDNVTIRTELMMETGAFTVGDYGVGTFTGRRVEGGSAAIPGGRFAMRFDEGVRLRR